MFQRKRKKNTLRDWRANLIFSIFLILFLLLIVRLFSIQVLNRQTYKAQALGQYSDQSIIEAKRGDIISSDGYVLAGTQDFYLMFAEPKKIKNTYQLANDLAVILADLRYDDAKIENKNNEKEEDLDNVLSKDDLQRRYFEEIYKSLTTDLMWVPVQRDLTPKEKEAIEEKIFEGIGFDNIPKRYYPEGKLASHILGFVGSNEIGEQTGYFGIEGRLNEDLKGKSGRIIEEKDALGIPILMGSYKKIEPVQGRNVVLTINRAVQYLVEKNLKEGVEKYNALSGSVIVMDPFTGEVIALANYPNYSPGNFNEKQVIDEKTGRKSVESRNLAISVTYEPGSVMKPFTVASAIDLDLVTANSTFDDSGPVRYSDYFIDNWDGKHYGIQTIAQLLQKSNNIGAAWVGHQVGKENLYKYLSDFGIGSRTNIDLEGEDTGILTNKDEWSDIGLANISFGQGVSTTPLQVLNSFNAIANGGYLLQPKIISKLIDEEGETEIPVKNIRRVISKETSNTMIEMLEKAVEEGEAKYFVLKDYKIAGKTGTAQIPEGGKYSPSRTNATFVGFLSKSKSFSMIVRLEEPKSSIYAAETAVPLWMEIVSDLVKLFGVAPDKITSEN